jgi:hypothetical protein
VLKVQAAGRGLTGVRATVVLDEAFHAGLVTLDVKANMVLGWRRSRSSPDPAGRLARDLSDDERYDVGEQVVDP